MFYIIHRYYNYYNNSYKHKILLSFKITLFLFTWWHNITYHIKRISEEEGDMKKYIVRLCAFYLSFIQFHLNYTIHSIHVRLLWHLSVCPLCMPTFFQTSIPSVRQWHSTQQWKPHVTWKYTFERYEQLYIWYVGKINLFCLCPSSSSSVV